MGMILMMEPPEERAEIEAAREKFWKNRNQLPVCSDLFWRMQVSSSHFSQKEKKKNIVNKNIFIIILKSSY